MNEIDHGKQQAGSSGAEIPRISHEIREVLEGQGWQYAGREHTARRPLDSVTGRFTEVATKTADELAAEYVARYSEHGFTQARAEQVRSQDGRPETGVFDMYLRKEDDQDPINK